MSEQQHDWKDDGLNILFLDELCHPHESVSSTIPDFSLTINEQLLDTRNNFVGHSLVVERLGSLSARGGTAGGVSRARCDLGFDSERTAIAFDAEFVAEVQVGGSFKPKELGKFQIDFTDKNRRLRCRGFAFDGFTLSSFTLSSFTLSSFTLNSFGFTVCPGATLRRAGGRRSGR